jgi:hypothetical protein
MVPWPVRELGACLELKDMFKVEEGDIEVVTWSEAFGAVLECKMGTAKGVFEAILAFHRARLMLP